MTPTTIDAKVDALLTVLDEDIRLNETTLSKLDVLRNLLIKRDDVALEQLLCDLREQRQANEQIERRRQEVRQGLADELGRDVETVTLSALQVILFDPRRSAVGDRQKKLRYQIRRLKGEYALTSALVADCTRFNRSLMCVFFGGDGDRRKTYSATGAMQRQGTVGLIRLDM